MKVEPFEDGTNSRLILSHMVTSKTVLSRVASQWSLPGLFADPWQNLIGSWCVEFFQKHKKAPNKAIKPIYQEYAESSLDRETPQLIGGFLTYLSTEHEQNGKLAPDYVVDLAGKHFNRVRLERLREEIDSDLKTSNYDAANERVEKFRRVEMGEGSFTEPFTDEAAIDALFDDPDENLIEYPGALGQFFRHTLTRDGLVAFQAMDKSGKSYWLVDIAVMACEQRLRTAFFAVGDLTEKQMMERFVVRTARHPMRNDSGKWPYTTKIPIAISRPTERGAPARVEYDSVKFDHPLDAPTSQSAARKFLVKKCKMKRCPLRMICRPNDSISILGVRDTLLGWANAGWVCDVVVIDYADILAPIDSRREERDQINATWKKMRALSQELRCLVVTATQSDTKSYDSPLQSRKHFTGDKRKNAHATAIVGINVTDEEKEKGVHRLNYVVRRTGAFNSKRVVHVAGNLAIACPHLISTF